MFSFIFYPGFVVRFQLLLCHPIFLCGQVSCDYHISFLVQLHILLMKLFFSFRWCYFSELTGLKWRVPKHARVLKTKKQYAFFSADLFGFFLFFDFSSHYVSLTSSHLLFFCFMCVFEFFGDQWSDSSYSSYILTQISLMLFFRTYRLEMKSFETCKSLKDQKMVILFLCRSLWIFVFCRFFISLCFSNPICYFFCFMFVLEFFFVINQLTLHILLIF